MQISDQGTLDIFRGNDTKAGRRVLPADLHRKAAELLDRLNYAADPNDLRTPVSNRLEKLTGDRKGQWSVRINDKYRICFSWSNGQAVEVRIADYH